MRPKKERYDMKTKFAIPAVVGTLLAMNGVAAAADAPSLPDKGAQAASVTPDNFYRAESDIRFARVIQAAGGLGKFDIREPAPLDKQDVVHGNRDLLYSAAVFDLRTGPVTITMPDAGPRFMSLVAISEDEYVPAILYRSGSYTFTEQQVGTRYVLLGTRTMIDPADPKDLARARELQKAVKITGMGEGRFDVPDWDQTTYENVRAALLLLALALPDLKHTFGTKADTDPVRHLIGSALNWGGNPDADEVNLKFTPTQNDGTTIYKLDVKDVPVDGFWSISVYNSDGYFEPNKYGAYTLNSEVAKKSSDGSITVQFGGCDGKVGNCLPTMQGWNYVVRLYRPRAEILDGKWTFPAARSTDRRELAVTPASLRSGVAH